MGVDEAPDSEQATFVVAENAVEIGMLIVADVKGEKVTYTLPTTAQ
jgi:hypothetical protein